MKRAIFAVILLLFSQAPALATNAPGWSWSDLEALERWVKRAPQDALPRLSTDRLETARASGKPEQVSQEATDLALQLARIHLLGRAGSAERAGWNIADSDRDIELEVMLEGALESHTLDTFFAMMRPVHAEYSALKSAYQVEGDPQRQTTIARNMERWRWMPRDLGDDYVLVNAPQFEAALWRGGAKAGTWRVIVGKRSTPTPVFAAQIEGVILNPWWNIPASIVRESVGALVRRNPAAARARGYVWSGGRYRQRPGPGNALGQMKLVMPNRFSVYMHDTPGKQLFEEEVRAYSHGCVRTGDAIGYAATLLEGVKTREEIDAILESRANTQINLVRPIPVYLTYFTAVSDGAGGAAVLDDIYNRDRRIVAPAYGLEQQRGGWFSSEAKTSGGASFLNASQWSGMADWDMLPEC